MVVPAFPAERASITVTADAIKASLNSFRTDLCGGLKDED
jgi:hypothetical protein